MLKKKIILFVIFCILLIPGYSQDLHFSQFFNAPLSTNPANTGFIPDADYRLGLQYRNQWSSIMAMPYKTMSAFADAQFMRDKFENGWLGLGAFVQSDVVGSGSLRSTKVYGSLAYHQMLGLSSLLSAGFNLGWANKRINPAELKFPDQWDGTFFDGHLPTSVVLQTNSVSYFDMQAGLNYAYFPTEDVYINAGYSIHHVNKPKETFFDDGTASATIPMRQIAFINAIVKAGPSLILKPNIYFTTQAKASELIGGFTGNYNLSEAGETQLIAGVYYRHKDAIIPVAGFELNNLQFTFSYDITMSSLKTFNNGRGALEFSLVKKGFYPSNTLRQALCPKF